MAVSLMAHYLRNASAECILHLRYLPRTRCAMPHHRAMGATTRRPLLVLAGIVLSALALRPQIIAIGPLVDAIDADLGVSHTVTGCSGRFRCCAWACSHRRPGHWPRASAPRGR